MGGEPVLPAGLALLRTRQQPGDRAELLIDDAAGLAGFLDGGNVYEDRLDHLAQAAQGVDELRPAASDVAPAR